MKLNILLSSRYGTSKAPFTVNGTPYFVPKGGENPKVFELSFEEIINLFTENGINPTQHQKYAFNMDGHGTQLYAALELFERDVKSYSENNPSDFYTLTIDAGRIEIRVIHSAEYLERLSELVRGSGPLDSTT